MTTHPIDAEAPFGTHAPGPMLKAVLRQTGRAGRNWLGRRRVFFWRALGVRMLRGHPADVERLGCRLRLDPAQNVVEKRLLFTPHSFDPEERAHLATHMRPDFAFADVGANVGGYALFVAAMAGPRARIVAIEPQPDIFKRLAANIARNGFSQVVALESAVSDKDEQVTLYLNAVNKGESSLFEQDGSGARVTVTARRLARLLSEAGFDRLDALKLDVEGMEDLILTDFFSHAEAALWPTILIVEDAPTRWRIDLPQLIEGKGYTRMLKTRTNLVYQRT